MNTYVCMNLFIKNVRIAVSLHYNCSGATADATVYPDQFAALGKGIGYVQGGQAIF